MIRSFLSYLVLILVPAVSLAIAAGPYVWVKKKAVLRQAQDDKVGAQDDNSGRLPRSARNDGTGFIAVPLRYLWGAFFIGLVGNVVFYYLAFQLEIFIQRHSLFDSISDGLILAFIVYSLFIIITPFIFYKFRHGYFTGKAIVYNIIISLITAGLVLGVWIVLALVAYRGLFYRLN